MIDCTDSGVIDTNGESNLILGFKTYFGCIYSVDIYGNQLLKPVAYFDPEIGCFSFA